MTEIWKPITGYEGLYEISNLGRVKSVARQCDAFGPRIKNGKRLVRERIIKPSKNPKGYLVANLHKDGVSRNHTIARLVASAFIPNPYNKPQIDHIDNDKTNNHTDNLRWVTARENLNNPISLERRKQNAKGRWFGGEHKRGSEASRARTVIVVDPQTQETRRYECMTEMKQYGFNPVVVSKCCRKTAKHHRNMVIMYAEDYDSNVIYQ